MGGNTQQYSDKSDVRIIWLEYLSKYHKNGSISNDQFSWKKMKNRKSQQINRRYEDKKPNRNYRIK